MKTISTTYSDGHAWIIDGYETQRTQYTYSYKWEPNLDNTNRKTPDILYKSSTTTYSTQYLRMNWGWSGSNDDGRYALDGDWDAGGYNFQYKRRMFSGFTLN